MAWLGVCGHHREVRQRASADEYDRVMEHAGSNEERSRMIIENSLVGSSQRNVELWESDSICARNDQNDTQRKLKKQWEVKIDVTHSVWP